MVKDNAAAAAASIEPDRDLMERVAQDIYLDLITGRRRGYESTVVAEMAYGLSRDFVRVTQAIRAGARIPEYKASDETLYCRVRMWDLTQGEVGRPRADRNGQPVFEVQPVDRHAHAPNLPDDHPINQRFEPIARRMGILCDQEGNLLPVGAN